MGRRGPLPKRLSEPQHRSSRVRKVERGVREVPVSGAARTAGPARGLQPDPDWHDIARWLWDAACRSPQNRFYEETDWVMVYSVCDELSSHKKAGRRSAQMLASINAQMVGLLFTEGDRRRLGIELSRVTEEQVLSPGVEALEAWRKRKAEREEASGS